MRRFDFNDTPLAGVKVAQRKPLGDARGFLTRFFCADEFRSAGLVRPVIQVNHTLTRGKGVIRGMHFQLPPHAEMKVVGCLSGAVFDIAVDLRAGSPTFLNWHGEIISAENFRSLLIPEGFAHGFQTLSQNCELVYLHTAAFHPGSEGALNPCDPAIGIQWPEPISEMSDRDRSRPFIDNHFAGIHL